MNAELPRVVRQVRKILAYEAQVRVQNLQKNRPRDAERESLKSEGGLRAVI